MVSTPKPLSWVRPGPDRYEEGDNPAPVLAVGEIPPVLPGDKWGVFIAEEQPALKTPNQSKNQRFRFRWLRQKDHQIYQSPTIPQELQERL